MGWQAVEYIYSTENHLIKSFKKKTNAQQYIINGRNISKIKSFGTHQTLLANRKLRAPKSLTFHIQNRYGG